MIIKFVCLLSLHCKHIEAKIVCHSFIVCFNGAAGRMVVRREINLFITQFVSETNYKVK